MRSLAFIRRLNPFWLVLGLCWSSFAVADAQPAPKPAPDGAPAVAAREPTLRRIHDRRDAALVKRIELRRAALPEPYRSRNNFAWAEVRIAGVDKQEYFAHSGIQDLDGLSAEAAEPIRAISLRPAKEAAKFTALCVNQRGEIEGDDCWLRSVDTEYKILEDLAARIEDPAVAGHVRLYTELAPCPSCWNVMKQFLAAYSHVQMDVLYRKK